MTVINLIKAYKQAKGIQKRQLVFILWGTIFVYTGAVDYFSAFGIEVYPFGFIPVILYFTLIAYIIIRYRAFEIDTVIHRTALWFITSLWLILPAYLIFNVIRPWLQALNTFTLTIAALGLFYVFLWYYRHFQPRIDHLFRRRKYDYQTILGKVAEKISTTINIEDLTQQLLTEVCETMYLRNGLFYVLAKDENKYILIGRRGYQEVNGVKQRTALEIFTEEERRRGIADILKDFECDSPLGKWLITHPDILEREQIELNPQYASIKEEALHWFKDHEVEVFIPLTLENNVNALLGLGKKENLQAYTLKDLELLKKLGQEAGVTLYNALHYEDLAEKERLEDEMKLGRDIQMNLLPRKTPEIAGLKVNGMMLPAKEIGGDYYDYIHTLRQQQGEAKNRLGIVIGDVSGKGVAAGLIMAAAKATLKGLSQQELTPKQILSQANNVIFEYTGGQKFMTLLYFQYKEKDKILNYSSAGHEHILIYRNDSSEYVVGSSQGKEETIKTSSGYIETIQSGGFMLGMLPNIETFLEERQIELNIGDKILLYTDGVTEAENASGDRFSLARLKEAFLKHSTKSAPELIQAIKDEAYAFIGTHPQYDDITLVALEAM